MSKGRDTDDLLFRSGWASVMNSAVVVPIDTEKLKYGRRKSLSMRRNSSKESDIDFGMVKSDSSPVISNEESSGLNFIIECYSSC